MKYQTDTDAPSPRLSSSEPWVPKKSSWLETSLMNSSSESILAVVGVAESLFFEPELTGLSLSVGSIVVVDWLWWERGSDAEADFREPWAAFGSASSAIASAAFLFRVIGGVVNVTAKMPARGMWEIGPDVTG